MQTVSVDETHYVGDKALFNTLLYEDLTQKHSCDIIQLVTKDLNMGYLEDYDGYSHYRPYCNLKHSTFVIINYKLTGPKSKENKITDESLI